MIAEAERWEQEVARLEQELAASEAAEPRLAACSRLVRYCEETDAPATLGSFVNSGLLSCMFMIEGSPR